MPLHSKQEVTASKILDNRDAMFPYIFVYKNRQTGRDGLQAIAYYLMTHVQVLSHHLFIKNLALCRTDHHAVGFMVYCTSFNKFKGSYFILF